MTKNLAKSKDVVVGVDGSTNGQRALEWAVDEGRRRNERVVALHAWELPYPPAGFAIPVPPQNVDEIAESAAALLDKAVGEVAVDGVVVEQRVVNAPPSTALVEASADADLVVVGARGHGGFLGLLLGSVSNQVAHHARCPVVIVRDEHAVGSG
jgi:nucleotide-binding universal stress UspA family protein